MLVMLLSEYHHKHHTIQNDVHVNDVIYVQRKHLAPLVCSQVSIVSFMYILMTYRFLKKYNCNLSLCPHKIEAT